MLIENFSFIFVPHSKPLTMIAFKKIIAASIIAIIAIPFFLSAKVQLPSFFSDGMVLQQQTNASVWGWAKQNAAVKIITSWNKKSYSAIADGNGKWMMKIATPVAGGPSRGCRGASRGPPPRREDRGGSSAGRRRGPDGP